MNLLKIQSAGQERSMVSGLADIRSLTTKHRNSVLRRLDAVDRYLKQIFQKELSTSITSFDRTTSSLLEEMKCELMRGVARIESIETAVERRHAVSGRLEEHSRKVHKLIQIDDSRDESEAEVEEPNNEEGEESIRIVTPSATNEASVGELQDAVNEYNPVLCAEPAPINGVSVIKVR
jgi:hypothetical protein